MNVTIRLLTAIALLGTFTMANAEVIQAWNCKLHAGKSEADLQAVSSAWLAAARKLPGNEKLEVWHNFPVAADVGDGGFLFVAITPDFKSWGNATDAAPDSGLGKASQAWYEVASCSGNSLWASEQVK